MFEAVILGLLNGLTYALLAVGIVLVYKAARFVNFAHAQIGVVPALLLAKLVLDAGISWWVAFPACVALGAGIGYLCERFIIRRLTGRSRLSLLVATVGLSQVLLALTYFPSLRPNAVTLNDRGYPLAFHLHVRVGALLITGADILVLILVPLLGLGLALFFKHSLTGKLIRAVAVNPEATSLAGVPVHRISAIVWMLAGALSALSAILHAPSQAVFDVEALGPALLLRALGAAALGGFTSLPIAFAGGIGLGVVEEIALHLSRSGGTAELVVLLVIVGALFLRSRSSDEAGRGEDQFDVGERVLRIPAQIADRLVVRHGQRIGVGLLVGVGLAAPLLPVFSSAGDQFVLALTLVYALLGVSLVLLVGWAGQVSLGQFALLGSGAYLAGRVLIHHAPLPVAAALAGTVCALLAVIIGLPALRLKGLALGVTTLGFAVVAPAWLFDQPWFATRLLTAPAATLRGYGELDSQRAIYYTALGTLLLVTGGLAALRRSAPGRIIRSVRDNPTAALAFGISPESVKLSVFALSGFIAGLAGALYISAYRSITPQLFAPQVSLLALAIPVVGGIARLSGPIYGAVALYALPLLTAGLVRSIFDSSLQFTLLLSGAGLLATQLHAPGGIASVLQRSWQRVLDTMAAQVTVAPATAAASPDEDVVLAVTDITVSFGGIVALDGISLSVRPGEVVGLIGANGAGKTTLFNVISGFQKSQGGSVQVLGRDVTHLGPVYRSHFGLARTFQDARLFPGLTVHETLLLAVGNRANVGFLSAMLRAPWVRAAEKRLHLLTDDIVRDFGLSQYAQTPLGELSTGTRRIVDVAALMATRPKIALLDEPTAGVAQREAEAFGPILRRAAAAIGCALLVIEHDMPLMMSLADRIYCLERGTVLAEGSPEEIRHNPRVVASYLGSDEAAIARSTSAGAVATVPRQRATRRAPAAPATPAVRTTRRAVATPAAAATPATVATPRRRTPRQEI